MLHDGTATIVVPRPADLIVEDRYGRNLDNVSNPPWIPPPFCGGFFSEDHPVDGGPRLRRGGSVAAV
jgi:hypothetical protein